MSSAGMQQGMKQGMVATASVQLFMRALQATNTELRQMAVQALAANPALEERDPLPADTEDEGEHSALDTAAAARHDYLLESLTELPTLGTHLEEQLRRSALPAPVEQAALLLISALDAHGMFTEAPADIAAAAGIAQDVYRAALRAVQDLDPAGVGAADLRESLILQLERLGEQSGLPMQMLQQQWDALVRHRYADAARALGCSEREVELAARRIARLNPDPGSGFAPAERMLIVPDLTAEYDRSSDTLTISLTGENVPQLTLSADYREMMAEQADKPEVRRYLSHCFREGRELIKAIADRQATILTIARAIAARQRAFFIKGAHALAPLKMEDTAADTGLSISTVSRAVNGKFIRCAHGVYELRSFFSAALPAEGGEEGSTTAAAVQARIRALVAAEDSQKPLSDAKLEAALAKEGITVARRTIAKYREQMKILPASLRRR